MKVGVQLPEVERVVRWPEVRRMAVLAEDALGWMTLLLTLVISKLLLTLFICKHSANSHPCK